MNHEQLENDLWAAADNLRANTDLRSGEYATPVLGLIFLKFGSAMREAEIEAFEYPSARCPEGGINVGLFTPAAFAAPRPRELQPWFCETRAETVTFAQPHSRALHRYPLGMFTVEGRLPWPAG